MRLLGSVCVIVLLSASAAHAQKNTAGATPAELQGTWKVAQRVYSQDNADTTAVGKALTALGYKIDINDGKLTPKDDGSTATALTFTYDDTQSPKTIDISLPGQDCQCGQTLYGIYKLECGILSIAIGNGATRPAAFQNQLTQVVLILKKPQTDSSCDGQ
jgi:uncharacterized protein (TIGR03067 family)